MSHYSASFSTATVLNPRLFLSFLMISTVLAFSSCIANRMVPFNQSAYDEGKAIKNEALNLMSLATSPFADKKAEVNSFEERVATHIANEEARGEKNKTSVDMWKLLMKPDGNLLGGFLTKWKNDSTLSSVLVTQFKREIGENFNKIIDLENKKKK